MKVVILCGGQGTRLREETEFRPKPMVEIGQRPILWHIMKMYSHHGFREFVLCLGYRGNFIKEYFLNYEAMNNDFTIGLGSRPRITFPRRPRRAGLPGDARRHRPGDDDRRAGPAGAAATSTATRSWSPTATEWPTSISGASSTSITSTAGSPR